MNALAVEWTFLVALLLATVHVFSPHLHARLHGWEQTVHSAGGGLAIGYVFLTLLPEVTHSEAELGADFGYLALAGFVVYYALESTINRATDKDSTFGAFELRLTGACALTAFVVMGLPSGFAESRVSAAIGVVALALHLLHTDHSLLSLDRVRYERHGRWILAIVALAVACADALLGEPDERLSESLIAFLAGSILLTVFRDEFRRRHDQMAVFLGGVLTYAAVVYAVDSV